MQKCKHAPREWDTKSYSRNGKGGVNPHKSAILLIALFPKSAVRSYGQCLDLCRFRVNISQDVLQVEISIAKEGSDEGRCNYQHRHCTYVLRMTSNGKIYNDLRTHGFKKFFCGWFCSVHNCYVLQSRCVENPFERLDATNILHVIHDSVERKHLGTWRRVKDQGDVIDNMSFSEIDISDSESL